MMESGKRPGLFTSISGEKVSADFLKAERRE
jgi:hypothetical protein